MPYQMGEYLNFLRFDARQATNSTAKWKERSKKTHPSETTGFIDSITKNDLNRMRMLSIGCDIVSIITERNFGDVATGLLLLLALLLHAVGYIGDG